jgi:hypothetical protein
VAEVDFAAVRRSRVRRADAALAGLVAAANRYSRAKLVGSVSGMQLQAGVGQPPMRSS